LRADKHFTISQFQSNERWLLHTDEVKNEIKTTEARCKKIHQNQSLFDNSSQIDYHTIGNFCDIGNGLVSGLDKAFQL
jgi:adenine-specific DNA-methyltransferase